MKASFQGDRLLESSERLRVGGQGFLVRRWFAAVAWLSWLRPPCPAGLRADGRRWAAAVLWRCAVRGPEAVPRPRPQRCRLGGGRIWSRRRITAISMITTRIIRPGHEGVTVGLAGFQGDTRGITRGPCRTARRHAARPTASDSQRHSLALLGFMFPEQALPPLRRASSPPRSFRRFCRHALFSQRPAGCPRGEPAGAFPDLSLSRGFGGIRVPGHWCPGNILTAAGSALAAAACASQPPATLSE